MCCQVGRKCLQVVVLIGFVCVFSVVSEWCCRICNILVLYYCLLLVDFLVVVMNLLCISWLLLVSWFSMLVVICSLRLNWVVVVVVVNGVWVCVQWFSSLFSGLVIVLVKLVGSFIGIVVLMLLCSWFMFLMVIYQLWLVKDIMSVCLVVCKLFSQLLILGVFVWVVILFLVSGFSSCSRLVIFLVLWVIWLVVRCWSWWLVVVMMLGLSSLCSFIWFSSLVSNVLFSVSVVVCCLVSGVLFLYMKVLMQLNNSDVVNGEGLVVLVLVICICCWVICVISLIKIGMLQMFCRYLWIVFSIIGKLGYLWVIFNSWVVCCCCCYSGEWWLGCWWGSSRVWVVDFWNCDVNSVELVILVVMIGLILLVLKMNSLVFGGLFLLVDMVFGRCIIMLLLEVVGFLLMLQWLCSCWLIVSVSGLCICSLYGECKIIC